MIALITSSLSRSAGGIYDAVRFLAQSMKRKPLVLGLKDSFTEIDAHGWGNIEVRSYKKIKFSLFGYSPLLWSDLKQMNIDLLHLHGIWMYPQLVSLRWKLKYNKPVVISPHGMLDAWALKNSSIKKKIIRKLFADKSFLTVDCIHALCYSEYKSIRKLGINKPIAIIPNGINIPEKFVKVDKPLGSKKTLLFIGRIHPKKGIELLIDALNSLKMKDSTFLKNWNVEIIGWDQENHLEELKIKCSKYNLQSNIRFVGPLFGEDKKTKLKSVDAFILPSYSEGLPMSVLEAWSYRLPVLMTKECNLPEGFKTNSAIELKLDSEHISLMLEKINKLNDSELIKIGDSGFKLVSKKFTWEKVAIDMEATYNWLLTKKNKPDFIKIN